MAFTSVPFFGWLAAAVVLFYLLPGRFRPPFLFAASCAFYATWSFRYLFLMLGMAAIAFLMSMRIEAVESTERTVSLLATVFPILGSLALFKGGSAAAGWLMPLGISYYTFKLLSYVLEVYWGSLKAIRSVSSFGAYVTFGPQILSGPIQRPDDFFAQVGRFTQRGADFERIDQGLRLILGGLMLKLLIGDRLRDFISVVDGAPSSYTRGVLLVSTLCYTIQLYADFAGYTNIAIGLGKLFSIDSPPNFAAPFSAPSMVEFWRRWHMSLTTWLTDYVFMPLRMATRKLRKIGLAVSLMITFILIGVWHGFFGTFLVFGLLQGIYMTAAALTRTWRDRFFEPASAASRAMRAAWGVGFTYLLMSFSQIWFQATSLEAASIRVKQLAGLLPAGTYALGDVRTDIVAPLYFCIPIAFYVGAGAPGFRRLWEPVENRVPSWALYGAGLLILSALTTGAGSKFIYGQF